MEYKTQVTSNKQKKLIGTDDRMEVTRGKGVWRAEREKGCNVVTGGEHAAEDTEVQLQSCPRKFTCH